MTDNDNNNDDLRISAHRLKNSQFCVLYAGDRMLCTITLHGDNDDALQVSVANEIGGFRSMMTTRSHTSVSWNLHEWYPNNLFVMPDDDKEDA